VGVHDEYLSSKRLKRIKLLSLLQHEQPDSAITLDHSASAPDVGVAQGTVPRLTPAVRTHAVAIDEQQQLEEQQHQQERRREGEQHREHEHQHQQLQQQQQQQQQSESRRDDEYGVEHPQLMNSSHEETISDDGQEQETRLQTVLTHHEGQCLSLVCKHFLCHSRLSSDVWQQCIDRQNVSFSPLVGGLVN
jgi:hypothetical protein